MSDRQKLMISVIVPVYNCEDTINLTVDSLLNQTYKDIEIILVDDGSKDGSGDLCDQYELSDSRITAIHQDNKGAAVARNTGIRAAKGKYVSFIDAGDYVELNLYESLLPYVNEDIDLIDFPFYTQNRLGRFPSINKIEKNKLFERDFIEQKMMPCLLNVEDDPIINDPPICFVWKYLFKNSIIDENGIQFDERRRKWEDKGFIVKYVDCCDTIVFFDKPLYTYICLGIGDHLSSSYFRELALLIIEQREVYLNKYGKRYHFETDYYMNNSLSTILARVEEIVANETEENAKELINEIYSKAFVQKVAQWSFKDDNGVSLYQNLIKKNDVDGTYLLMKEQIEQKKNSFTQEKKAGLFKRAKQKVKRILHHLYNKMKSKNY